MPVATVSGGSIDASSTSGLDGDILIDSPSEITGSVLPLATPGPVAARLLTQNCVPRLASERSTLTVQSRGALRPPTGYQPSPAAAAALAAQAVEPVSTEGVLAAATSVGCGR